MKHFMPGKMKQRGNIGLLFISLWLIGFLVFRLGPFIVAFCMSFTDYNLVKAPLFNGLENYIELMRDPKFLQSLGVTFRYVFVSVPLKLAFALFIAYLLNSKIPGIEFFRTAYYIPSILGGSVAVSVLWRFMFSGSGLANAVLSVFQLPTINWLGDPAIALYVVSLLRIWQFGSAMVIFLAALKNVPEELYEAALIEGASRWKMFTHITIPIITPVVFFNFILQLVQAFQEFNGPYLITKGGPLGSTSLLSLLIYDNAFSYYKMGYASAMAWVLFIIILILTLISFNTQKYWVHYSDE